MSKKRNPGESATLRQQAEEILHGNAVNLADFSAEDTQRLIHELQVYQIELDLQNEELREAQVALEAARDRYSDLYDFAPVGYFAISNKGLILEANLTGSSLLGIERGKLLSLPLSRFIIPDDQDLYYFCTKQLSETGKLCYCEVRLMSEDNGTFWVRLDGVAVWDDEGNLSQIRITMSDITERKQVEKELAEHREHLEELVRNRTADLEVAVEQLQELDHMKAEFVANISHELRTPLSNFVVYLHLLGLNPEKQGAYVATLKREAHRLASIVEDLIFVSRWNPEQQDLDMAPVDINALVETYITDRTPITENSGLALTLKQMPALPKVQADQKRLEQVLDVLLSNAFNYTPSGGQVIVCTQTSRVAGEQWVGFNVSDTGVGIPREEQFKIFDRFYRGTGGHDSGKPGIGLGLAIAREIIDGHQGRIEVESEGIPGKGSIFSVWLPVHAD